MVIKQRNISFDSGDFFSLFIHPNFPPPPPSKLQTHQCWLCRQSLSRDFSLYSCWHTVKGHLKVKPESQWLLLAFWQVRSPLPDCTWAQRCFMHYCTAATRKKHFNTVTGLSEMTVCGKSKGLGGGGGQPGKADFYCGIPDTKNTQTTKPASFIIHHSLPCSNSTHNHLAQWKFVGS